MINGELLVSRIIVPKPMPKSNPPKKITKQSQTMPQLLTMKPQSSSPFKTSPVLSVVTLSPWNLSKPYEKTPQKVSVKELTERLLSAQPTVYKKRRSVSTIMTPEKTERLKKKLNENVKAMRKRRGSHFYNLLQEIRFPGFVKAYSRKNSLGSVSPRAFERNRYKRKSM